MRLLLVAAVSPSLVSCVTGPEENLRSPSGRFEVSYQKAGSEMDASYGLSDSPDGDYHSICTGGDTPFKRSKFLWSASELTALVLQESNIVDEYDRFVFFHQGADKGYSGNSKHWLIKRKPLEIRYFDGRPVRVASVSDMDVTFLFESGKQQRITLEELREESLRQENQPRAY